MDTTEYAFIESLAQTMSPAGRMATVILSILNNTPIDIPCEMIGNCEEEERFANTQSSYTAMVSNIHHELPIVIPNPASTTAMILIPASISKLGNYTLNLFDFAGKHMMSQTGETGQEEIMLDFTGISQGMYFFSIRAGNAQVTTGKITVIK